MPDHIDWVSDRITRYLYAQGLIVWYTIPISIAAVTGQIKGCHLKISGQFLFQTMPDATLRRRAMQQQRQP